MALRLTFPTVPGLGVSLEEDSITQSPLSKNLIA
jgi:hypothetical protein